MMLATKVITGILHAQNKGACDWGWQGMVAYGCHCFVVIVDPKTVQVIQVLDKHKANVVKIKWSNESYNHDLNNPYALRLASADANGVIIIWDVAKGTARCEFSEGNKPIADLKWVDGQDASHDLVAAIHPPYSVILWNADTGTRLWKKSYTETLLSFAFDPFNSRNIAFLGQDCIVFIDDFSITKCPSSNGKKYYISSPSSQSNSNQNNANQNNANASERRTSATNNLAKRMSKILVGESKQSKSSQADEENVTLNECLQLTFHRVCRHHLILLYPREVLILDLEINQTVGIITMDRVGSPLMQVLPCRLRDIFYCLHENGSITVRVRRKTNIISTPASEGSGAFDDTPPQVSMDVAYDLRCQSEALRVTRHNKVYGIVSCAVSERTVAMIMSDSKVIFWDLQATDYKESSGLNRSTVSPLYTPGATLLPMDITNPSSAAKLPIISNRPYPKLAICDMIGQSQVFITEAQANQKRHGVSLKFLLTGLLNGITSPVTVIRMCPPLTTKNWNTYEPILCMGTQNGSVQIFNLASGQLDREYSLHSCTVRGIEWVTLQKFISFGHPNPGASGLVKNEIFITDVLSGKATQIRTNREDESPIELLKISHLKQYFVLTFKDKPFELWDLRSCTLIREMPKSFPHVTALEWSPSHSMKNLKRRLLTQTSDSSTQSATGSVSTTSTTSVMSTSTLSIPDPISNSDNKSQSKTSAKEHYVFTDPTGILYHFIVEGNTITDGSKIPPEGGMGVVSAISWKGDNLVFGDVDGSLYVWDLKARVSRSSPTHRGWVKKIRFAPGRGNLKFLLLYNDGVDIWDIKDGKNELVSSVKSPREVPKVIDAEWAGSDKPVLVMADGCLRVYDLKLKIVSSPVDERELPDDLFCPHLLEPRGSLLMKCILQHQPWNEGFSFRISGLRDEDKAMETSVGKQLDLLDSEIIDYLPHCQYGVAQRCLITARLFGDEADIDFWTVALHYLRIEEAQPMNRAENRAASQAEAGDIYVPTTPGNESVDSVFVLSPTDEIIENVSKVAKITPLERCYDVLCDFSDFQKYQLDRIALHDSKRATYDHTRKCAENYMLLGQTDRAVQLLLETDADNENYYTDSLRACLVASIRSSGASQSTIKLVATNLIANGKLAEGVQLLCLIDKGLDGCRYLQTYGSWDQAVWLAKSTLSYSEYCEVLKRWADHLCSTSVNQKSKAVLVMLSLGQFHKVLEMLYGARCFDRAARFAEACLEFGVIEKNEETSLLIEAVFLEFARLLSDIGHRAASEHYCGLAGDKGVQYQREVEILFT